MDRTQKDFNDLTFAQQYIKGHTKMLREVGNQYVKKLRKLNFNVGKILDAGCGFGEMDIVLAKNFPSCEITGIDLSEPLLNHANQLKEFNDLNERIHFLKGDINKLPFENQSFDVVFCINMVHWVDNPQQMLNEINRVLKPEGHLYIKDLRYSWLKILENEIGYAFTLTKAREVIGSSDLSGRGIFIKKWLWWEYEV